MTMGASKASDSINIISAKLGMRQEEQAVIKNTYGKVKRTPTGSRLRNEETARPAHVGEWPA